MIDLTNVNSAKAFSEAEVRSLQGSHQRATAAVVEDNTSPTDRVLLLRLGSTFYVVRPHAGASTESTADAQKGSGREELVKVAVPGRVLSPVQHAAFKEGRRRDLYPSRFCCQRRIRTIRDEYYTVRTILDSQRWPEIAPTSSGMVLELGKYDWPSFTIAVSKDPSRDVLLNEQGEVLVPVGVLDLDTPTSSLDHIVQLLRYDTSQTTGRRLIAMLRNGSEVELQTWSRSESRCLIDEREWDRWIGREIEDLQRVVREREAA